MKQVFLQGTQFNRSADQLENHENSDRDIYPILNFAEAKKQHWKKYGLVIAVAFIVRVVRLNIKLYWFYFFVI